MAHAVKVGSKRNDGAKPERLTDAATPSVFTDEFLDSWIDSQLGPTECRLVLVLCVGPAAVEKGACDFDADSAAASITSNGGLAIRRSTGQLIGVWGTQQCDIVDRERILKTAQEICSDASWHDGMRCLLHSKKIVCGKSDHHTTTEDVVVALAHLVDGLRALAPFPEALFATDAFRAVCDLQSGLLPVSVSGALLGREGRMLYALDPSELGGHFPSTLEGDGPLSLAVQIDALGDLKPLYLAASVIGRVFTAEILARVLGVERQRQSAALAAAQTSNLIDVERLPGDISRYVILNDELRCFAYDMIPPQRRLRLHRQVAEALRQSPTDCLATPPDQVAHHYRISQNPLQSRRWLSKAAWRAVATNDAASAISHLEKALAEECDTTPVSASRRSLFQLLGVQLALAKGNGADAVFDASQSSIGGPEQTSYLAWRQEARSLWLAQSTHLVKGEVRAALTFGTMLLFHLQRQADSSVRTVGMRILVHRMQALSLMLSGQLAASLEYYDKVVRDYDPKRHAKLRFAYGSDQLALAHAHRAWVLALTCRPKEALAAARDARRVWERLDHPHTTAHAVSVIAIASLAVGAIDEALFAAREARAIAVEYRFPYWVAWADVILAAAETPAKPRTTYDRLQSALRAYQATGAAQLSPFAHALLSAAAHQSEQHSLALQHADMGLALMAQNGCVLYRPELCRRRALALHALGRSDEADTALQEGYSDAQTSGATLFKRAIARDGIRHTAGQQQINWQALYHAAI